MSNNAFNGMDMLKDSLAQMVGELRMVGQQINYSVRTLSSSISQQSAAMGGISLAMHQQSMGGGYAMNQSVVPKANFLAETFSKDFNKPSFWARDIMYKTGIMSDPNDMTDAEAQYYAGRNLGRRGKKLGLQAARYGTGALLSMIPVVGKPLALGFDITAGEFLENEQQKDEWQDWLNRTGSRTVLSGNSTNTLTGSGWSHTQERDIAKHLAKKDKKFYNTEAFKYEELQELMDVAESGGYFFNTLNVEEFKRKQTQLINNTKEVMKTMKMTLDEAGSMLSELSFAGFSSPMKSIKEMNSVAAATGLSIGEVKNYGIGYARQQWAEYGVNKDDSSSLALSVLKKYNKQQGLGAEGEMTLVERLMSSNKMMAWGMTSYDPATGKLSLDHSSIDKMLGMDVMEQFEYASKKFGSLSPNDTPSAIMQMNAIGPALMYGMNNNDLLKVAASGALSPIKMILEKMDPSGFARAIEKGGDDPWGFLRYVDEEHKMVAADYIKNYTGVSMGAAIEMIESNKDSTTERRGPKNIDDMSIRGKRINKGFLGIGAKYEGEEMTLGRLDFTLQGYVLNMEDMASLVWNRYETDPDYKKSMEVYRSTLEGQRDGKEFFGKGKKNVMGLIKAMGYNTMGNFTHADIQAIQDKRYIAYGMNVKGMSSKDAQQYAASQMSISELSDIMAKGVSAQYRIQKSEEDYSAIDAAKAATRDVEPGIQTYEEWDRKIKGYNDPTMADLHRDAINQTKESAGYIKSLEDEFRNRPRQEIEMMLGNEFNPGMAKYYRRLDNPNIDTSELDVFEASMHKRMTEDFDKRVLGTQKPEFIETYNAIMSGKLSKKKTSKFLREGISHLSIADQSRILERVGKTDNASAINQDVAVFNEAADRTMKSAASEKVMGIALDNSIPGAFSGAMGQYMLGQLGDENSSLYQLAISDKAGAAKKIYDATKAELTKGGNKLSVMQEKDLAAASRDIVEAASEKDGSKAISGALKEITAMKAASGDVSSAIGVLNQTMKDTNASMEITSNVMKNAAEGGIPIHVVTHKYKGHPPTKER